MSTQPTFNDLHQTLTARYDLEELCTLCAQIGVPYDDLRGEGRSAKARELVLWLQRRDRLDELAAAIAPDRRPALARGQAVSPARPASPTSPIRERWALLVGVDHYHDPAVPTLKYCVNDVLALERALRELGYTVITLRDDASDAQWQPTRNNVEARLALLCQSVQPDDLLLVHFACHGHLAQGAPVLVMQDTHITTPAILARQSLPLAEVERQMRGSQARRLVLTLDACHTGVEMGRDLTDPQFIHNAYELAEGFALIAASTTQQIAQEWREKEHGVFTYHLLEGLGGKADRAGKGFVTVDDLKTHVLDGLRRWNVAHGGVLQEPTVRSEGMGDIILADYRQVRGALEAPRASASPNPFGKAGRITDPAHFFDRQELLRQIFEELGKGVNVSLVGASQVGKSSLLSMVCALGPERMGLPPESFGYLSMQWVESEDGFYAALCDTLGLAETCRGYQLTRALRGKRYTLCLDEIEKMAWDGFTARVRSQLRGLADGPAAPLKLVIASRSPLSRLFPDSPELDSPLAGICRPLDVGPFSPEIARAFIADRLQNTGVAFTESEVAALLKETGGHPAKLQRAAADLYREKKPGF